MRMLAPCVSPNPTTNANSRPLSIRALRSALLSSACLSEYDFLSVYLYSTDRSSVLTSFLVTQPLPDPGVTRPPSLSAPRCSCWRERLILRGTGIRPAIFAKAVSDLVVAELVHEVLTELRNDLLALRDLQ